MISVNSMVRDEPFAFYAVASVAPYVEEVLLYDTGSKPEFYYPLLIAQETFPNVKLVQKTISADAHGWSGDNNGVYNNNEVAGKELGDIRREMHEKSLGDKVFILDGDEVYTNSFVQTVIDFTNNHFDKWDGICIQLPVMDFVDKEQIRQLHHMGRIFKKNRVFIKGDYPHEMHCCVDTKECLMPWNSIVLKNEDNNAKFYFFHYECMIKPWRKTIDKKSLIRPQNISHPEVFNKYKEGKFSICHQLIEKYGF